VNEAPSVEVWKSNHTLLVDHEIVMRASIMAKRKKIIRGETSERKIEQIKTIR